MDDKRIIWTVLFGAAALTGWRHIRTGSDPIPQLAGIGATGIMLLITAEFAPKLGSGFAILLAITLALNWDTLPSTKQQPLTAFTPVGTVNPNIS